MLSRCRWPGPPRPTLRRPGSQAGTAVVEFALVLPLLISLLLGSVEVFRVLWLQKKTVATANSMGEMISSTQTALAASDLQFISDSGLVTVPQVLTDAKTRGVNWWTILQSNYASVVFTKTTPSCTSTCTYTANVAWSSGPNRRACGTLSSAADTAAYTKTTLPQSLFGPGSLIVVDVQYAYQPMFGTTVLGPRLFTRSAFFVPRYVDQVKLGDLSSNPGIATICPGYS